MAQNTLTFNGRPISRRQAEMLMALIQMERQRQGGKRSPSGGRPQKSTGQKVDDYIKRAKELKKLYDLGKTLYNNWGGGTSTSTPTTLPNMSGGATSTPNTGFTSVQEMVGNGLYTPAPTQYQTPAGTSATPNAASAGSESSFSFGDAVPYVNAAIAAYNAHKLLKNKDMDKDQRNLAVAGAAAQASTPWTGGYGAAAASALNAGSALMGDGTEEEKTQQAAHQAGMAVANFYTAGLAGLADNYARKQWGGTMKKVDNFMWNNPLGAMYGLNLATRPFDTDAWKKEGNRVKKLLESGVDIPEPFRARMYQTRGLSKKQLVNPKYANDFQGWTDDGYVNNKFENTRDESDMTYETLAPYAVWAEKRNDWWKLSDAQRRAITDRAQKAGAVREHHGTLDVDWDKVGDIDQIVQSVPGEQPARPGRGQVMRTSAGMYMDDKGRVYRAGDRNAAMSQAYGGRIPRQKRA